MKNRFWNPTGEFMRQLKLLMQQGDNDAREAYEAIEKGTKRPTLTTLMDTRSISGENAVDFFGESDPVYDGLRNLAHGKIPADTFFMPYAIQVLGVYNNANEYTDDNMGGLSYKGIHTLNGGMGLENGTLTIRVAESSFINKLPLVGLHRQENSDTPIGMIELPATEIFRPQQTVYANYKSPKKHSAPNYVAMQVILHGVVTSPKSNG